MKIPREKTLIFRVQKAAYDALHKRKKEVRVDGIDSVNQLARKLVLDFLSGKLAYKDASDFAKPSQESAPG